MTEDTPCCGENRSKAEPLPRKYECNFCGKDSEMVDAMIVGLQVNICSECISLCCHMVIDHIENKAKEEVQPRVKIFKDALKAQEVPG